MMDEPKKMVSELAGTELDYWVARAMGLQAIPNQPSGYFYWGNQSGWFSPSTDWAQGGPIIEREKIAVLSRDYDGSCRTCWAANKNDFLSYGTGETPLIAAMRCYVSSKFGDSMEEV